MGHRPVRKAGSNEDIMHVAIFLARMDMNEGVLPVEGKLIQFSLARNPTLN